MLVLKLSKLLNELSTDQYKTAIELAQSLGVSEKTIRIRIKELNDELKQSGATVQSKKSYGYLLKIDDKLAFDKFQNPKEFANSNYLPTTSVERIPFILAYLLNHADYIKLADLSEFLYVSRNTLTADFKKVEYILTMFDLSLERRPNYGIVVKGSEFNKRICIANSLIKRDNFEGEDAKKKIEIQQIADILLQVLNQKELTISEISFESLVVHIYISIGRIRRNCQTGIKLHHIQTLVGNETINLAKEIASITYGTLGIDYDLGEVYYLAIHLAGKLSSDTNYRYKPNIVISGKIDELALHMITIVYDSFKFDFRSNLELRMSLNQHLVPFHIRMKYGIPLKNPILNEIKKEYALAHTIASGACLALSEYYGKKIPEDEIGYFAMIFALALEKKDKEIEKKNIVIVCVSGKGSSQLFIYRYKQAFGKYINHIFECSAYELMNFDFKQHDIDYVFTTIPLNINIPVPVFEVNLFFEKKDIDTFCEIFEMGSNQFLYKYYRPELFISPLKGETKEEILQILCQKAGQFYNLPKNFYQAVMKRELLGQSDFGNLVAIPHPYKVITKENFVVVGILENPIWWGHNEVQIVFLISLSTETDADIERFYQLTTNLLFDYKKMEWFINHPDFQSLMDLLCNRVIEL